MTMSIAVDYVKRGIRCNCICPARDPHAVRRRLSAPELSRPRSRDAAASSSAYQPIGRMGTPEEVAALALYLCSDEAAFVTGRPTPSTVECSSREAGSLRRAGQERPAFCSMTATAARRRRSHATATRPASPATARSACSGRRDGDAVGSPGVAAADASAPDRDHRRRRHRADGAPAGVSRARLPGRRHVRRPQPTRPRATATRLRFDTVFPTLAAARVDATRSSTSRCPAIRCSAILEQLPRGAAVLMQKPMGPDLAAAHADPRVLPRARADRRRQFSAALQPECARAARSPRARRARRRSSTSTSASSSISRGISGRSSRRAPRLEVPYHSIHYLDAIRWLVGEPSTASTAAASGIPALAALRRHAQLDHPRLRRPHALLADAEPHAPRRPALPRVADDRRRASTARRG